MAANVVFAILPSPPADELEIVLDVADGGGGAIRGILAIGGNTIAEVADSAVTTVFNHTRRYWYKGKGCGSDITFTPTLANASANCHVNLAVTGWRNASV